MTAVDSSQLTVDSEPTPAGRFAFLSTVDCQLSTFDPGDLP